MDLKTAPVRSRQLSVRYGLNNQERVDLYRLVFPTAGQIYEELLNLRDLMRIIEIKRCCRSASAFAFDRMQVL